MQTKLEQALNLRFPPLAIFYAHTPPAEMQTHKPLCSMMLVAQAAKGRTVTISLDSCGCSGANSGFALAPLCLDHHPEGRECFLRFLSVGNKDWEYGRAIIEKMKARGASKMEIEEFSEGEGFLKSTELVDDWVDNLPKIDPEAPFVIIKPLNFLKSDEEPRVVTLLVDATQMSALVVLANFARKGSDNVRIPFTAGCASLALYPFYECTQENPRAVVGLTDISARFYLRKAFGKDIVSFTAPWDLFKEMEENVSESFLTRFAWKTLISS